MYQIDTDRMELRSLENPTTNLSDPDDWLWDALGADGETCLPVAISETSALRVAAYFKGVNLIASDCARIPLHLLRYDEATGKTRDIDNPLYHLVHSEPNDYQDQFEFVKLLIFRAIHTGNGYAYIQRDQARRPLQLLPLETRLTKPFFRAGKLFYKTEIDGQQRDIEARNMFHLPGFSRDGITGVPLYQYGREELSLSRSATAFGNNFFANNARPGFIVEVPATWTPQQRGQLNEELKARAGIKRAFGHSILPAGCKATPVETNAKDAMLNELKDITTDQIAAFLGLNPSKLGRKVGTSHNSLEQEAQEHLDSALDPWLCKFEQQLTRKLLTEEQRRKRTHEIRFNRRAYLRMDAAARASFYSSGLQNGWITPNEVRGNEDMNALPNAAGNQTLTPLNLERAGVAVRGADAKTLVDLLSQVAAGQLKPEAAVMLAKELFPSMDPVAITAAFTNTVGRDILPESSRARYLPSQQQALHSLTAETAKRFAKRLIETRKKGKPEETEIGAIIAAFEPLEILRGTQSRDLAAELITHATAEADVSLVVDRVLATLRKD